MAKVCGIAYCLDVTEDLFQPIPKMQIIDDVAMADGIFPEAHLFR